jgi:hypothetical protein
MTDIELVKLSKALKDGHAQTRHQALVDAARDVCMYCDGRAFAAKLSTLPNAAGNYTHGSILCPATSIWSRIAYERG